MADERAGSEHTPLETGSEIQEELLSFRASAAATSEWIESFLERLPNLPVLAQVEPGEVRSQLPAQPPEHGEPFTAVLDDLEKILLPGLTQWNHTRFFAYFPTTASEPGILARRDRARAAGARLGRAAARPAERVVRAHRRHRFHLHTLGAGRGPRGRRWAPRGRLLGGGSLLGRQGLPPARARAAHGSG